MLKRLWQDTHGAVISPEIAVVGAILLIGVIVGLSALRMAILTETKDLGEAVHAVDFTPKVTPIDPPATTSTSGAPTLATDLFDD